MVPGTGRTDSGSARKTLLIAVLFRHDLRKLPTGRGHSPGGGEGKEGVLRTTSRPHRMEVATARRRPVPGQVIEVRSPRSQLKVKHRHDDIYIS